MCVTGGTNDGCTAIDAALNMIKFFEAERESINAQRYSLSAQKFGGRHNYYYCQLVEKGAQITLKNIQHAEEKDLINDTYFNEKNIVELYLPGKSGNILLIQPIIWRSTDEKTNNINNN